MTREKEKMQPFNDAGRWVAKILDAVNRRIKMTEQFEYDTAEMLAALIRNGFTTVGSSVDLRNITGTTPERILVVMSAKKGSTNIASCFAAPAKFVSPTLFKSCIIFAGPEPEEDTGSTDEFDEGEKTAEVRTKIGGTLRED